jgi:hypothetical protein
MLETNTCPEGTFKCSDGDCRTAVVPCNGVPECPDGFDEKYCNGTSNGK